MAKTPTSEYDQNPSAITLGLALNMAWQLAIVFLVPVFAGHFIDSKTGNGNTATIIGLVIATAGMIVVVSQTLKRLKIAMKPHVPKEQDND